MNVTTPISDEAQARIARLSEEIFIGYDRAVEIEKALDSLLAHPKIHRMPAMTIVGESNNGKSMLLHRFVRKHTPKIDPNDDKTVLPVLLVNAPAEPDENRLYQRILSKLYATGPSREHPEERLARLRVILGRLETRMIIIDEFSNAAAGSPVKQQRFLNALKGISNDLEIPVVAAGLPSMLSVLASDPQLANRFDPERLPVWKNDRKGYASLLLSFETQLGLAERCQFASGRVVDRMLDATDGLIGDTSRLLRRLAERAVRLGTESIRYEDLDPEVLRSVRWVRPADRQRMAASSAMGGSALRARNADIKTDNVGPAA